MRGPLPAAGMPDASLTRERRSGGRTGPVLVVLLVLTAVASATWPQQIVDCYDGARKKVLMCPSWESGCWTGFCCNCCTPISCADAAGLGYTVDDRNLGPGCTWSNAAGDCIGQPCGGDSFGGGGGDPWEGLGDPLNDDPCTYGPGDYCPAWCASCS